MSKFTKYIIIFGLLCCLSLVSLQPVFANGPSQLPTVAIPTVTSTSYGPYIIVRMDQDQINVRSGPGVFYPKVGVLLAGQQAPAKGRSVAGEWILIEYLGVPNSEAWVYSPLVDKSPGDLPIVEPPPTPTPQSTTTIDPTLAAQFIVTAMPSRLPTYTAPPPLVIPSYDDADRNTTRVPMGLIILVTGVIGIFLGAFSILQGR